MGVVLIGGLYLWNRNPFSFSFSLRSKADKPERTEPSIAGSKAPEVKEPEDFEIDPADTEPKGTSGAERVITLRLMGRAADEISSERAVLALRAAGLTHGRFGIFHALPENGRGDPFFSVASLTEPGAFNFSELEDTTLPGMSFFMVLPGPGDPVTCFDEMVQVARTLSKELDAELFDERGSSWSIQRERYIREEIIEFRHLIARS